MTRASIRPRAIQCAPTAPARCIPTTATGYGSRAQIDPVNAGSFTVLSQQTQR